VTSIGESASADAAPAVRGDATDDPRVPWITLVAARDHGSEAAPGVSPRGVIVRLAAGLAVVLIVVGLVATFASQWLAEREAVNDAANVTDVLAEAVVQPALTTGLVDADPAAVADFDDVVRDQLLAADVVRVKIWSPDGVVLYADEPQLIGRTFALDDAQREALAASTTRAAVSDLSEEENEFESGSRLLEVYRPVWAPDGRQMLFEVYLPYEPVAARSADLWRGFAGVTTSSLLLLVVATAPIVWGLLARLRREERRRADLLQHAVDASDAERRRVAGTLHDGPVQELVATSLVAEGAADAAARNGDHGSADHLRGVAAQVRGNVRALRTLLMDIYPPSLTAAGLGHALGDLAATARARGVVVDLRISETLDDVAAADEQLLYRVTQEALRNTVTHAAPCGARIRVDSSGDLLVLEVSDDGPGFDPHALRETPTSGHLGTRVLVDLAAQSGAELSLATAPGRGTRWRLRIRTAPDRKTDER
jgi:two-component system NarL family sensor kinase